MLTILGPRRGSGLTSSHNFCGLGGDALGWSWPGIKIALGLNHNQSALATHEYNFPEARHECVDLQTLTPAQIREYPATDFMWASAECKYQSTSAGEKLLYQGMKGLWGDLDEKPHVERSRATMKEVVRWASVMMEQGTPYRAVVTENVNEVMYWHGIKEWYIDMDKLGYRAQTFSFNSMFTQAAMPPHLAEQIYPIAQNRNRWYTVFTLKGNPAPDLTFRPRGWCPRCNKEVHSQQVWKECARSRAMEIKEIGQTIFWGDYGEQYLYYCPLCDRPMVPYHTPSYAMIDWSIPMKQIGARKNMAEKTIKRLRHGLERSYQEGKRQRQPYTMPFLVDLAHSEEERGYVRPITAPYYTQTTAQTAGVVLPPQYPEPEWIFHTLKTPWYITEKIKKIQEQKTRNGKKFLPHEKEQLIATIEETYREQVARYLEELPIYLKAYRDPPPFPSRLEKGFIASYHNGSNCLASLMEPIRTCDSRDRHGICLPPSPSEGMPSLEECLYRLARGAEVKRAMGIPESFVIMALSEREETRQSGLAVTPGTATLISLPILESLGETVPSLQCA